MSEVLKFHAIKRFSLELDAFHDGFLGRLVEELVLGREVVLVLVLAGDRVGASGNEAVDAQTLVHGVHVAFQVVVLRESRAAVVAEEVFGTFVTDLHVHLQLAVGVELLAAAGHLAGDLRVRVDLQVPPQVQTAVEEVPADLARQILHAVTLHMHLHVLHVEKTFAAVIAQMVFDLLVHRLDVDVELRLVEEAFAALDAQADFLPVLLVHRHEVRLESVFAGRNEVAVGHIARELLAQVLRNVTLDVTSDFGFKVAGIIAEVAEKSLHLDVNHLLMLRQVLHEDSAARALLA